MIPFDLEKAKKGIPIITRSRHTAKFIAHLNGGQPAPLVIEVMKKPKDRQGIYMPGTCVENYYANGRFNDVHDSELDLFMEY